LTVLVMVGVRTEAHIFRSQVGIGSESGCLLGQLKRILDISDSDAGLKEEKLEGSVGGEGECGGEVEVLLERDMKFGNFVCEALSEAVSERRAWGRCR